MKNKLNLVLMIFIISSFNINAEKISSWGWNYYGQLGDGSTEDKDTPYQIGKDASWLQIACGDVFTVAIKKDGTLWGWGYNENGQVGDGTTTWRYSPFQIGKDTNWSQVSCGSEHSLALKKDGTLWAWGYNEFGQLGIGTHNSQSVPIQIGKGKGWAKINTGGDYSAAIKIDGSLWAWGKNEHGQLGDGTTTDRLIPVQIGIGYNWLKVTCGNDHTIAIKNDGTLWAFGNNIYGQLGDGSTVNKILPVQIGTNMDWQNVSCGQGHTVAIKNDGTLWAWGYNYYGQFGNGTTTSKNYPIQIGSDNNWSKIACGSEHTLAIKLDKTLWSWGLNLEGELGDGTTKNKSYPVKISSNMNWVQIDGGVYHSVALSSEDLKYQPTIKTNSPICDGDDLLLFAETITDAKYFWYGPNNFKSNQQNPIIKNAKSNQSGTYYLYISKLGNISDTVSIDIKVNTNIVIPGDSSLIFVGSAAKIDNYIRLTESKPWDGGSLWLKNRFSVKQDFSTTFKFRVFDGVNSNTDEDSSPGADGIAFVMQNHIYPFLGDKGGSMGYTGISNSLAIEFDLFKNNWDPNGNHIAVQSMGSKPNQPDHRIEGSCLGINDSIITINDSNEYYVKIAYTYENKTLMIYLDTTGKFTTPSLTIPNIDLASYLQLEEGEYVYIGFTSGTGESYQEHIIYDWTIPCKNQLVKVDEEISKIKKSNEIKIVPNPASEFINIEFPLFDLNKKDLYLYSTEGILIDKITDINGISVPYNISKLNSGVYTIIVTSGFNTEAIKFIVVKYAKYFKHYKICIF